MPSYENVRYEVDGFIATVTVAREKALNALNRHTLNEIAWALGEADGDARVRCVILTGAGEKAFVAGADISEMVEQGATEARGFARAGRAVGDVLENMAKPVIAAVNGFALGGGCELALACDFIYASDKARFGQPEVNLGVIPGFGGTQRLPRRIGAGRAMELVLTGDLIGADEALRIGLVNKVFPAAELMTEARKCADKIASKGPLAISYARRAVRKGAELSLSAGNDLEAELFALLFATSDQKEGMRAFLAKRSANFEGK
ncbi:MAG: enoyl-CoA hydratase/carnithine racemase [Myxococcales bacterium]|nr:enoyl-CoA hydratase/carnithine racemase [Myxococcales bacterium]